jgi:hypothetical protein
MKNNTDSTVDRDARLDRLAAELTNAVYPVALRHRRGNWVDLELDLWHALAETVRKWERNACLTLPKGGV